MHLLGWLTVLLRVHRLLNLNINHSYMPIYIYHGGNQFLAQVIIHDFITFCYLCFVID
jgi:hypothetical protein